ncbi:MAG: polyphosphate polymerase domain-containing protein [Bacillota bacterium]|nr:polyphosphate polymerase domain-containing protein [Bacillota bacterium]
MRYEEKNLRHELKFYINYHEYYTLKQRLKYFMELDSFVPEYEGYHVRSLYFDDVYDSSLYEKNSGVNRRQKYRIRIYNKSDSKIRLERKSKYGQYISKETAILTRQEYNDLVIENKSDFLIESQDMLKRNFYFEIRHNLMKPKVIVDYEREAFLLGAGNVRITFDKKLEAGIDSIDILECEPATVRILPESVLILEIKYDDFLPGLIKNLIQFTSHDISAISKYVMCREALNDLTMK